MYEEYFNNVSHSSIYFKLCYLSLFKPTTFDDMFSIKAWWQDVLNNVAIIIGNIIYFNFCVDVFWMIKK